MSKTTNDVLAGSAAGTAQVLASQPLDTIKTRAQIAPSALSVAVYACCS
jgi:solute carrier family 25 carnitine/acylcarnitine transporter 20/29